MAADGDRAPGLDFALSFSEGRGVLSLPRRPLAALADLDRLDLEIPDVRFPFDVSTGVQTLRRRRCVVRRAALSTDVGRLGGALAAAVAMRPLDGFALTAPSLAIEDGIVRFHARIAAGEREVDFTAAAWVEGPPLPVLRLVIFDARAWGFFPRPAPQIVADLLGGLGASIDPGAHPPPFLRRVGACSLEIDALGLALLDVLPPAGWRLPERSACRLDPPSLMPDRVGLGWGTAAGPAGGRAPTRLRGEIALHREAHHAFAAAEAALAAGDLSTAVAAYRRAAGAGTPHPFAQQRLLQILSADEGSLDEAARLAREVLDRDPDSPAALLALAVAAAERGEPTEAIAGYERLGAVAQTAGGGPFDAPAARRAIEREKGRVGDEGERAAEKAAEHLAFGQDEQALSEARRAVEIAPSSRRAAFVLAEAATRAGEMAEAQLALTRLLDAASGPWDLPVARTEVARRLAAMHEKAGDAEQALHYLRASLEAGASGAVATQTWQRIVDLLARRGDAGAAAEALVAAATDDRTDESARDRAARLVAAAEIRRKRLGDAAGAEPLFERAVALDPLAEGALDALETIATDAGSWNKAAGVLARKIEAAARRPGEQKTLIARLAWISATHLGDADRAAALYREALEIDPAFGPALLALARDAWQRGDRIESLRRYTRLLEADAGGTPPEREEAHIRLALGDRDAGRLPDAIVHLEAAAAAMPRNSEALDLLIEVLAVADRAADQADALRRRAEIEESSSRRRDLWFKRGQLLEALARRRDAVDAYRQALKASPYDAPALLRLADIHRAEEQPAELGKALERLIEIHESRRSPDLADVDPADLYFELANVAQDRLGDTRRAEIYLLRLLLKRPESEAALEHLTRLLVKRGALEEADRIFERRMLIAQPGRARSALAAERARTRLLAPNGEAAALEVLLELDSDAATDEGLELRAQLTAKRGDIGQAAADLRVLVRRASTEGDNTRASEVRRRLLAMLADPEADGAQARAVLNELLTADPFDGEVALTMADREARLGDPAERVEAIGRLLERAPGLPAEHRARLHRLLGDAASQAGDVDRASEALDRAIKLEPDVVRRADHVVAHARLLDAQGEHDTAIAELDDALASAPDHPLALALRAGYAYEQQDWEEARRFYTRLSAIDGGEPVISREEREFRRAELAEMFGDEAEAEACYRAIAASNPKHVDSREALAQVAVYREDWGEAARLLEEVLRLLPLDALERLSDVRHRLGEIYARLGDLGSARRNLELVLAQDGSRLTALELIADLYERLHLWPEAAESCARLARVHAAPIERAKAIYRQAEIVRTRLSDENAANDLYLKASDLDPHHGPTLRRLGDFYWERGDIKAFADVIAEMPDDAEGSLDVETVARAAASAALTGRDPARLESRLRRTSRADPAIAARVLAELARRVPGEPTALDPALLALSSWGDPISGETLAAALTAMVADDPSDVGVVRALARLLDRLGHVARARALLSLLVFLDPEDPATARLAALGNARAASTAALDPEGAVQHPGCAGPLRRVLCATARTLAGVEPVPSTGGTPIDKQPALSATLSSVARRLGAPPFHAVTRPGGSEVSVEAAQPATVVIGAGALALPQAEFVFLTARAVDEVRAGTVAVARLPPDELPDFLQGVIAGLTPRDRTTADGGATSVARKVIRHITQVPADDLPPPERWAAIRADAAEAVAALPALGEYLGACRHTANRVGLLACTMPLGAFRALARLEGWHEEADGEREARSVFVKQSGALRELIRYVLGGTYDAAVDPA